MSKASPLAVIVGLAATAFILNYAVVWMGFKPMLYCGFKDIGWRLFQPFQLLISLSGGIILLWGLVTRGYHLAFIGVLIVLAAYIIPEWGRVLFSLGRAC